MLSPSFTVPFQFSAAASARNGTAGPLHEARVALSPKVASYRVDSAAIPDGRSNRSPLYGIKVGGPRGSSDETFVVT